MIEIFPELNEGEFALSRADVATGIVLDESLKYASTPDQKVYTIYGSLPAALSAAKLIISNSMNTECYIHAKGERLIYMVTQKNIDSIK
jgi:hypothetical protein